ncbi:ABC transporter ATP-binding protein [Kouleothrix sp.]|uniref:ABC transporter ATP-binding protein n=1 Tax=Kouleothrix sp. TaxID=2779161 RepID=UPI00391B2C73
MNASFTGHRGLLLAYLRPRRAQVALLSALLFGGIALELLNPQILRGFIDAAMAGGAPAQLTRAALLFIGVALAQQLVTVGATYMSQSVGWSATNELRADLIAHCLGLDLAFHKTHTPGELIERVDGDVTALATFFSQFVILVLGNGVLLLGVLALLFREDWRVGAALTLFVLVALAVLNRLRSFAVPQMAAERAASADLFGFLEERLAGIDDIRANGAGGHVLRGFAGVGRQLYLKSRAAGIQGSRMWSASMALFTIGYTLALGLGAYLYMGGAVTIGTVYLFFQYTELLRRPLEQIADQLRELQRASAGVGRIVALAQLGPTLHDGAGAALPDGALAVEFGRVSFGYDDESMPGADRQPPSAGDLPAPYGSQTAPVVLADVSFALAPGRVLGLLGRTGSGKTTLTRLLFRLYDPTDGAIRLGGADLRALTLADLRARVGIVTQDVQLFGASIRDNLTLFDRRIDDARIMAALAELGLREWLDALPHGLDSELGPGGGGLSAGEAQLLAFTRVFLRDPGLVILDEASSRLDPATERLIERAVGRLLAGRTGIIIAHRLATVQRADEILILEGGRVLEHGPRAALAADAQSRFATLLRVGLAEVLI